MQSYKRVNGKLKSKSYHEGTKDWDTDEDL